VAEFDAELYLRLAGERTLLDPSGDDGPAEASPLEAAGHALVAVGAITAGAAQAIVDDYQLALSYRRGEHPHRRHVRARRSALSSSPGRSLGVLRAVACGRLIEQPWGQLFLRYLVLRSDSISLHVSMRASPATPGLPTRSWRPGFARATSRARRARPGPGPRVSGPGLPQQLTITDDQGTSVSAGLSGGGNDHEWDGEFEASPGLAQKTAWIEVLGERVELPTGPSPSPDARVEPLTAQNPAVDYLWARVAVGTEFHGLGTLESSIEALVAAGSLASDDPAIAEARAVTSHLSRGSGGARAAGHQGPLPEPWRSMMARRGRGSGPDGLVVAGVTTPEFDGITAAVLTVSSADEGFSADVEMVPGLPHWRWLYASVDQPLLVWWAADDRGHHYLGHHASWHSSLEHSGGQIEFWPALDPAARVLDIMPTTMAARAVIRVPLEWGEDQ
jgi:hypothetical protein